jgi:cytidyltransferase-like protein
MATPAARQHSVSGRSTTSDDLSDYDLLSASVLSLDSSADLSHYPPSSDSPLTVQEPPPTQAARDRFATTTLAPADVRAYVRRALESAGLRAHADVWDRRTVRVYVDGAFERFHAGHALQLRQAKLSFPSVRLVVGVFGDTLHAGRGGPGATERAELVRHCRWVDEVLPDAPERLDAEFLLAHRIDVVAVEEGISLDPACSEARYQAYEALKGLGKVIPTRRTFGLAAPPAGATPGSIAGTMKELPSPLLPPPPLLMTTTAADAPRHAVLDEPGTPKSPPSVAFEDGPPLDIFGIGI